VVGVYSKDDRWSSPRGVVRIDTADVWELKEFFALSFREMRTVLMGDSHAARLIAETGWLAATPMSNAAQGGAAIGDVLRQASSAQVGAKDVVVLSIGTNDAAPWKQTPLADYRVALDRLTRSFDLQRWIYMTPPGVDESRLTGTYDRTNSVIGIYREEATTVLRSADSTILPSHEVIAELGSQAFTSDGVHLTAAAYSLLLPEIAKAIASVIHRNS